MSATHVLAIREAIREYRDSGGSPEIYQQVEKELSALHARVEKAEAEVTEIKFVLDKYKSRANHIHAWGDFLYDIHKALRLPYDSDNPTALDTPAPTPLDDGKV